MPLHLILYSGSLLLGRDQRLAKRSLLLQMAYGGKAKGFFFKTSGGLEVNLCF